MSCALLGTHRAENESTDVHRQIHTRQIVARTCSCLFGVTAHQIYLATPWWELDGDQGLSTQLQFKLEELFIYSILVENYTAWMIHPAHSIDQI